MCSRLFKLYDQFSNNALDTAWEIIDPDSEFQLNSTQLNSTPYHDRIKPDVTFRCNVVCIQVLLDAAVND